MVGSVSEKPEHDPKTAPGYESDDFNAFTCVCISDNKKTHAAIYKFTNKTKHEKQNFTH